MALLLRKATAARHIVHTQAGPQKRYYGKVAKRGLLWGFFRFGANTLVAVPTTVVLARLLSPSEFGIFSAASFFLMLASRLTQFGFGVSLVRAKSITEDQVSSVFFANVLLASSAWAGLAFLSPYLGRFLRSDDIARVLPVAGAGFVLVSMGSVSTALLSRQMRWRDSTTTDWLGTITNTALSIVLAWKGFSYWSLVYAQLANQAVTSIARMWMVRFRPRLRFSRDGLGEIFSFGLGIYAKNLLDYAAQNLDNIVVGRLLGVTALGYYDKAFSFTSKLMVNINLTGPGVSFQVFALIHEERERFRKAYRKVMLMVTLVGYPVFTAMIVVAPALIETLFGRRWMPSVLPFQILCLASMLKLLNTYASTATQAKGMIWSEVKRQAGFTVVLVVAVALLCRYGIVGAAAGVLVAIVCMTVLMQTLVKELSGLAWRDMLGPQLPAVACSAQVAAALVLTRIALQAWLGAPPAPLVLAASLLVGGLCYLAFVLLAPAREMRGVVEEMLQDIAPGLARRLGAVPLPAKEAAAYSQQ
jgi:PST family polysaccharide transporter